MNQRDLAEIKRRLNPDRRNPSVICGCYVDHIGNPITSFLLPVASLYEQDNANYMALFRKVLSGQIGQSLMRFRRRRTTFCSAPGIPACAMKKSWKNFFPG